MQLIIDAFQYLFELIQMVFDFVTLLIESLFNFLKMLPTCIEMLVASVAYLPGEVMVFATLSISVSVIFIIVGRGSSN